MGVGAALTAFLFAIGKWALGLYLGSGSAAPAYGAASSLITLLLWVYYSAQILLFGAEFTQVYATHAGREIAPDEHALRIERAKSKSARTGKIVSGYRPGLCRNSVLHQFFAVPVPMLRDRFDEPRGDLLHFAFFFYDERRISAAVLAFRIRHSDR